MYNDFGGEIIMDVKELRMQLNETQNEFSARYNIPVRTIQNWENGVRTPPEYVTALLKQNVEKDLANRMAISVPIYDPSKKKLPLIEQYSSTMAWLQAVRDCLGENIVFALDEALMCEGSYLGRIDQWVVWVYGDASVSDYNGVMRIGTAIAPQNVHTNKFGLSYTCFNRTLIDAMTNENILDMQGITEALSYYYETHNQSFDGLFIPPEYQAQFDQLAEEAINYYSY